MLPISALALNSCSCHHTIGWLQTRAHSDLEYFILTILYTIATSVNAPNADPNASSLKATPAKKKKRALVEVMAEIHSLDSIKFNPID
jgi:hypothetical protein